jgi:formate hydrogenlyase subunit 3/multisubunit Na+/H+ antiporter MnhD subunit
MSGGDDVTKLVASLLVLGSSGVLALVTSRAPRVSTFVAFAGVVVAGALGLAAAVHTLVSGTTSELAVPWSLPIPGAELRLVLDPLGAWFLLPVFGLAVVVAPAVADALRGARGGAHWLAWNALVAAMALVVVARNTVLFLMSWESMVLAGYALMATGAAVLRAGASPDQDDEAATRGALAWLVASHLSGAFLVALFLLAGRGGWLDASELGGAHALRWLLVALVGFGTKAALVPFHPWAGDAYRGAPGHVAALLSGATSKLGIYGLLRVLVTAGSNVPASFDWILLFVGLASAGHGVLTAVAQRDLRRVLAATSVESAGFVAIALAVARFGQRHEMNALAVLGIAAALLHVLHDAVFKSLLFVGAGALRRAAGTVELDRLGGLLKRLPSVGLFLLVGAAALLALPPMNAFTSELLLVGGALEGAAVGPSAVAAPMFLVLAAVALVAGLALAGVTRAMGTALLGAPRDVSVAAETESAAARGGCGSLTVASMAALARRAQGGGLGAPLLLALVKPAASALLGDAAIWNSCWSLHPVAFAAGGVFGGVLLVVVALLVAATRRALLARRSVERGLTWDCGYHRPTARMQYTASSFGQPLVSFFGRLLLWRRKVARPEELFASGGSFATETRDLAAARLFAPLFRVLTATTARLRVLQHGRVHLYVLAIAATLLALLVLEVAT